MRKYTAALIAAAVLITAAVIGLAVNDGAGREPAQPPPRVVKKVDPPGPVAPLKVDTDNQLQPAEVAEVKQEGQADAPDHPDVHEDMRDETPPGIPQATINAGKEATEALAVKDLGTPQPPAGAQNYSCPNVHVGGRTFVRNRSSLNGPRVGTALHFTVSPPGSMNSIIGLFNTPSFGASSNRIIELSGACRTLVPNTEKAWAQLTANSAYFSIEIVTNDLTRAQWLAAPIIKRGILAALVRDLNRSIGAPLKLVDPKGCAWTPGVTDHDRLECGNVHWDVGRNFPWDTFMKQVRSGVFRPHVTSSDQTDCKNVRAYRDRAISRRKTGKPPATKSGKAAFERRLKRVAAHGLKCVDGKAKVR